MNTTRLLSDEKFPQSPSVDAQKPLTRKDFRSGASPVLVSVKAGWSSFISLNEYYFPFIDHQGKA
jgi:hypothetical protein